MPDTASARRPVPAVARTIAILRHLGRATEPVGVNALARELGLVPSTCLHILRALTDEGLVAFDPHSKRYTIDVGILPIARNAIHRNGFASLIEPRLTELSVAFGGTAVATQMTDSEHMVVVALSRAPLPFRLQVDLGSRFPALISATGRCHAAFNLGDLDESALRERFGQLNWDDEPDFAEWQEDVARTRQDGFAIDRGRYIGGVTIVAVPFFDRPERMSHSIVAIGISERLEAMGVTELGRKMIAIRDQVAAMHVTGG
ncbi:MAG: IclR family transcriptional regulator [Minwuia sp.]|uniref:IclR family transcriptional regulator n=1 Tax=Minwuia sp. TaxID=2493630 RepID=UPI003A85B21B